MKRVVWAVETGSRSDYKVRALFATKDLAEEHVGSLLRLYGAVVLGEPRVVRREVYDHAVAVITVHLLTAHIENGTVARSESREFRAYTYEYPPKPVSRAQAWVKRTKRGIPIEQGAVAEGTDLGAVREALRDKIDKAIRQYEEATK